MEYKYKCEKCNFNSKSKSNYDIHLKTKKHNGTNNKIRVIIEDVFTCKKCNQTLNNRVSFWRHNKLCVEKENTDELRIDINELKTIMLDIKNNPHPTNITNSNSNNNFNVNLFLNENFNNAKNFIDTINSISIEREYRDFMKIHGYVVTVCGMIKGKIDDMPLTERPIHCIKDEDANQHILHIRHDNKWKKETELEWTQEIHNYYAGETDDDKPDEEKKIIFEGLKKMEENITERLRDIYGKSVHYKVLERETAGEMNYVPNKIKIIKCLLEYINVDKPDLLRMLETSPDPAIHNSFITNKNNIEIL